MAKSVLLATGRSFPTVKAALDHFSGVLKEQPDKAPFAGADESDIGAAYLAYCAKTNWTLESPPAFYYPTHGRGAGFTTRCFGVTFEDGNSTNFSMEKALRTIAN